MSEITERSFTIGILGANHNITKLIGEALGSPGQSSDIQFYNRLDTSAHCVFTAAAPITYPEKIKSILQVAAISKIHIMVIDAELGITAEIGEIMVIMDVFARKFGTNFIAAIGGINGSNEWRLEQIQTQLPKLLSSTSMKGMEIFTLKDRGDFDILKKKVADIGFATPIPDYTQETDSKVLIDHCFPVKGVGTVALGLVEKGQIHAGEMYDMVPVDGKPKRSILRSIQKHDRDFKIAQQGDRVGLLLKGMKPEEIDRNTVFCTQGTYSVSTKITIDVEVAPFYKPTHESGKITAEDSKNYHIISDLAISPVKITGGDAIGSGEKGKLTLELEKPLPHDKLGLRGIIAEFGPFLNKLRVVGFFQQIL